MTDLIASLCPLPCLSCENPGARRWGQRLCPRCADEIPDVLERVLPGGSLAGGWALGSYAGPLGALLRRGKYGGDEHALRLVGHQLARMFAEERGIGLEGWLPDLVVPAPTSPGRSFWRGFDAVHLLANPVATAVGLPLSPRLRRWGGAPQASLDADARRSNLRGRIHPLQPIPEGSRVLLVDDVVTTGATAVACADALLGAGAGEVWLLAACSAIRH